MRSARLGSPRFTLLPNLCQSRLATAVVRNAVSDTHTRFLHYSITHLCWFFRRATEGRGRGRSIVHSTWFRNAYCGGRQAGWRPVRWDGKRSFGFALAGVRVTVGGRRGGSSYPVRESTRAGQMALIGRTVESGKGAYQLSGSIGTIRAADAAGSRAEVGHRPPPRPPL